MRCGVDLSRKRLYSGWQTGAAVQIIVTAISAADQITGPTVSPEERKGCQRTVTVDSLEIEIKFSDDVDGGLMWEEKA